MPHARGRRLWPLGPAAADAAPAVHEAPERHGRPGAAAAGSAGRCAAAADDANAAWPAVCAHAAGQHLSGDAGAPRGAGVRDPSLAGSVALVGARRWRGSETQTRPGLRASVVVVATAAMCVLVYACLAGDASEGRVAPSISARGPGPELGQRRRMSMLDFDDDDDGSDFGDGGGNDGGFGGGDSNSFGDSDSFSSADDLEDSGSYVGYLAWSDTKLQRILNNTRAQLLGMERSWNATFSPAHVQGLKRKVWLLSNAFSRHGYLLKDAAHGLETLHLLTKEEVRDLEAVVGAQNPKIKRELVRIVNRTQAIVAQDVHIDQEQGRRIIAAEQIDLNTSVFVRHKLRAAQAMLTALEKRAANVTLTLQANAAAFGRDASRDMHAPAVVAKLHALPRKFSLKRLADEAVGEEDMVGGKVRAEFGRLHAMEGKEERLLMRANMSALELQAREMKSAAAMYNEDADQEAAQVESEMLGLRVCGAMYVLAGVELR